MVLSALLLVHSGCNAGYNLLLSPHRLCRSTYRKMLFQGPTAPPEVYDLFLEFMQSIDKDAVQANPDPETKDEEPLVRLVPIPAGLATADESVNMNQLQSLLKLPYQDMKKVLTHILRHDAVRKQVRKGMLCTFPSHLPHCLLHCIRLSGGTPG
jgi:hypothetical protein